MHIILVFTRHCIIFMVKCFSHSKIDVRKNVSSKTAMMFIYAAAPNVHIKSFQHHFLTHTAMMISYCSNKRIYRLNGGDRTSVHQRLHLLIVYITVYYEIKKQRLSLLSKSRGT